MLPLGNVESGQFLAILGFRLSVHNLERNSHQTSNLNLRFPTMPQRTVPVWMPTRMLTDSCRSSSNSRIAEIIDRPISTQFLAWSGFGSGQPFKIFR